jgi:nucleoside-diphosphate-sugar epimerase
LENISGLFPNWENVSLRFTNIFGSSEADKKDMASIPYLFLKKAKDSEIIEIWSGNQSAEAQIAERDFLYVKDLCLIIESLILVNKYEHRILDVGTGTSTSLLKVLEAVSEIIPLKSRVIPFPKSVNQQFYQLQTKADVTKLFMTIPKVQFTSLKNALLEMSNELT